ncbi:MAG: hypothetical protein ABSC19_14320 [Syntrophorhabdales bacterium]
MGGGENTGQTSRIVTMIDKQTGQVIGTDNFLKLAIPRFFLA